MTPELKEQLSNLTLNEVLELLKNNKQSLSNDVTNHYKRHTLGRLDIFANSIAGPNRNIIEYSINVPEGILCYIKNSDNIEPFVKELNAIISKYQK